VTDEDRDPVLAHLREVVRGVSVADQVALLLRGREGLAGPAHDLAVTSPQHEGCLTIWSPVVVGRSQIDTDDEVVGDLTDLGQQYV
jgi:hypothetical protein